MQLDAVFRSETADQNRSSIEAKCSVWKTSVWGNPLALTYFTKMTNCWSTNISVTSSARQPNTFEDAAAQSRLQSSFDHDCQGGKSSGEPWDQLRLRMVYTWKNENTSNWPIQIRAKIWTVQEVLWTAQFIYLFIYLFNTLFRHGKNISYRIKI